MKSLSTKVALESDLAVGIQFMNTINDILDKYIAYDHETEKTVLVKGQDLSEFLEKLEDVQELYCDHFSNIENDYKLPKFVEKFYPNIA